MAYALVKAGTVATGTTSVAPAFGQATASGHLLIAWVVADVAGPNKISCSDPSWNKAVDGILGSFNGCTEVWYKPNSGASETAPSFSAITATTMFAAFAEFSGGATSAPVDQTNAARSTVSSSPATATNSAADVALGELLVSCGFWQLSKAGTCTTVDTYNNGATPTTNLNNDATSTAFHYRFAWGTTTGNSAADQDSQTNSSSRINQGFVSIASFKLPAAATPSLVADLRRVVRNGLLRR